jgi:glycosyltransferase involved in cell wall biosynthesis
MNEVPARDPIQVTFAPDWSQSVPYQSQLATALADHPVRVDYLRHYRRGLPLWRGLRDLDFDLFHLHWPEKFWQIGERFKALRRLRYPLDLYLASRDHPLIVTAHNLLPHATDRTFMQARNARLSYRLAKRIFVHSQRAGELVAETFGICPEKIVEIPFGDLSPPLGPLRPQIQARRELGLDEHQSIALIFGAVRPYKGIDQVIAWWRQQHGLPHLHVIGWGSADHTSSAYASGLETMAAGQANVTVQITPWLADPVLNTWLSAADVIICNHIRAFSSGGACLARSLGIPLMMPHSAEAVDLAEPDPRVRRFHALDDRFKTSLDELLQVAPDQGAAGPWREATSWTRVASITAATYRQVHDAWRRK